MSWLDGWRHRLAVLRGRERYQRDIAEELRFHLDADARHEHAGAADPVALAARRFGNVTCAGEEVRRMTGYGWLDALQQDVRFAWRGMRRSRNFAVVVVAALALGIGANTAIFSFVNNVVLRPLPYGEPGRLVRLSTQLIGAHEGASYPDFLDWRSRNHTMLSVAAYRPSADNLAPPGEEPERLPSARVTSDFLKTLGLAPAVGRDFTAADEVFGAHHVVIISNGLWRRRFGGDPAVVGKSIVLNTASYVIIGVAPVTLQLPSRAQLWAPLTFDPAQGLPGRRNDFLGVIGRMKPAITVKAAQADLSAVARQLAQEYPNTNGNAGVLIESLQDVIVGAAGPALMLLAGAVGLVLLIACANVANLLLARGATRAREMAVRSALGAGRGRLMRQLLTESVILAVAGGVAGLLLATLGVRGLKAMLPYDFPRIASVGVDGGALAFSATLSILTGILFGLVPAWAISRDALVQSMQDGGRGSTGARSERLRSGLVFVQTALALVLLSGAGVMVHSLLRLRDAQLGFEPKGALAALVSLPAATYDTDAKRHDFFARLRERLATLTPGKSPGLTTDIPLGGGYNYNAITIAGRPPISATDRGPDIIPTVCDSEYFGAIGMTLVAGRLFGNEDLAGGPNVAVVNQETATRYFGGKSPIGERITTSVPSDTTNWITIIGVVRNTKLDGVGQESYPQMFGSLSQNPQRALYVVSRSGGDPLQLVPGIRRELRALDPALPLVDVEPMRDRVADSLGPVRLQSIMLSAFSTLALLLAALGIYGVVAYGVAQRRREIGIRMALGARAGEVRLLVLRRGLLPVATGAIAGLGGSIALTQLIRGMTYGVGALDPATLATAVATLTLVAVIACLVPASRAAAVSPTEALRE